MKFSSGHSNYRLLLAKGVSNLNIEMEEWTPLQESVSTKASQMAGHIWSQVALSSNAPVQKLVWAYKMNSC